MEEEREEASWFFAESVKTGKWTLFKTDEEKLEGHLEENFDPKVGKALPKTLTDLLVPNGQWIIRLIPPSESEGVLDFLAAARSFAESQGGIFEYPWEPIVELVNQALTIDRANQQTK